MKDFFQTTNGRPGNHSDSTDVLLQGDLVSAHVLVVDDDAVIAQAVAKMLEGAGAKVHTSHSASEALDLLDSVNVEVVITDLKMGDIDGFDLMESVKARDNTVSVIIMSSHASPDTAEEATQRGASSYLRKPFKSAICIAATAKALRERHAKIGVDSPENFYDLAAD